MPQQYNPYATYNYDPGRFYYEELIRHFNTQKPKENKPIENEELISLVDNVNERLDSYFERTDQLLSLLNEIYNELNSPGTPNQESLNKAELKQFIEEMIRSRSKSIPTNPNSDLSSRSGLFSTETRRKPKANRRNRVNQNMELDVKRPSSRPHPISSAASTYAGPSFYPKPTTDEIQQEKTNFVGPSKSADIAKQPDNTMVQTSLLKSQSQSPSTIVAKSTTKKTPITNFMTTSSTTTIKTSTKPSTSTTSTTTSSSTTKTSTILRQYYDDITTTSSTTTSTLTEHSKKKLLKRKN